jgi:two-component system, chemotaxis family, protein-glutamate methylesterase/glutaminase
LLDYTNEIADKIRTASVARVAQRKAYAAQFATTEGLRPVRTGHLSSTEQLIIIGASTGGTEAIKVVLTQLPPDSPGVLITQHMPEGFTKSFANRLNGICRITVKEAEHGDRILPGHAYVAPGHSHLLLKRSGADYIAELSQSEPVNRHRPSVDVLFHSAAEVAGKNAIGVILTGMGKDGAVGMKEMHRAGAYTFAQDEASCVVFGMPKEAIAAGGVDAVLPLGEITDRVLRKLSESGSAGLRI